MNDRFDCVIMGAGYAGNCLARYLLLNAPDLKIALIDPRGAERGDRDLKVGESTIEIASMHLSKELGLTNYLIQHHAPKNSINFHWPKQLDKTESMEDYYSLWPNRPGIVGSYNINRAKFETDVLAMNVAMGATFIEGHVADFDLVEGDAPNRVVVRTKGRETFELLADNLVDATGYRQLIGRRLDNVIRDPHEIGVANASAWVRVRGVDRSLFESDWHPDRGTISSYYATNFLFGHGHWVWLIPSSLRDDELSVGVVFHKDKIPASALARREQLLSFLEQNHQVAHRLIASGEIVDFNVRKQIAFRSKRMIWPGGWCVLGDAAYSVDPFGATGTLTIAIAVETMSQVIMARAARRPDAAELAETFNDFNLAFSDSVFATAQAHSDHLGHPSLMSWRIFLESTWGFGALLPMYTGRFHLNPDFARRSTRFFTEAARSGTIPEALRRLDELFADGKNLGLLDIGRGDSLGFGLHPLEPASAFLRNTRYDPRSLNLARGLSHASLLSLIWLAKLNWEAEGLRGLLSPQQLKRTGLLAGQYLGAGLASQVYEAWSRGWNPNEELKHRDREFESYQHYRHLRPWRSRRGSDELALPEPAPLARPRSRGGRKTMRERCREAHQRGSFEQR